MTRPTLSKPEPKPTPETRPFWDGCAAGELRISLLRAHDDAVGRLTVAVLTTIIGEAGREVMASRSRREADASTDFAVAMIERLAVLPDGEAADGEPAAGSADLRHLSR